LKSAISDKNQYNEMNKVEKVFWYLLGYLIFMTFIRKKDICGINSSPVF